MFDYFEELQPISYCLKRRRNLVCINILILLSGCALFHPELRFAPHNSEEYYFPPISPEVKQKQADCIRLEKFPCVFEQNDTLSDFVNEWYSTHLASMKEPILYNQIGKGKMVVRFTHLGTWSRPYSYRIDNVNGKIIGTYNKTKGLGGYYAKRRIKHQVKELNISNWSLLITKIDSSFWDIQTHDPNIILDGEEWILEVLIEDKYHVVTRNSPQIYDGKEYAELCRSVMNAFND